MSLNRRLYQWILNSNQSFEQSTKQEMTKNTRKHLGASIKVQFINFSNYLMKIQQKKQCLIKYLFR